MGLYVYKLYTYIICVYIYIFIMNNIILSNMFFGLSMCGVTDFMFIPNALNKDGMSLPYMFHSGFLRRHGINIDLELVISLNLH